MANPRVILTVLDGFGLSPITDGNAVYSAKTPFLDWAIASAPKAMLHASGAEVGLDWGEMGNSEVGHLNLGIGRIIMQDLPRINRAIDEKTFFANSSLKDMGTYIHDNKSTLHLVGLASRGGVHAHLDHIFALMDFAKQQKIDDVALHLITDGRDSNQNQFDKDLTEIEGKIKEFGIGRIASISGRYYAMDRDKRWDRTEKAYQAMVNGSGRVATSAAEALAEARKNNETDEFIVPTVIVDSNKKPSAIIKVQDGVIFTNYRPDRARQLAAALSADRFDAFKRENPVGLFVSFTSYGQESSHVKVAFFEPPMKGQLAQILADSGMKQFHVAETEKYAHVTYFFNGGKEEPFANEDRILVPSPKVATYDKQPEMSAIQVTAELMKKLKSDPNELTIVNYANPDMVGHTGDMKATISAIETVDKQLIEVSKMAKELGAILLVTADHGNAEQMINPETHEVDKEHTTNPVPLFIVRPDLDFSLVESTADKPDQIAFAAQSPVGVLADVAPTILDFLGLSKPSDMTGQSLKDMI